MVTNSYIKSGGLTLSDYTAALASQTAGYPPVQLLRYREASVADVYREIETELPRLRRYARALTRDVGLADDLVQDCLARAIGKLDLWQTGTDLRAWLFTILHNQYVNYVRRAVREGVAVGLTDSEPLLTRAPPQGHRLELRDLDRAMAKLPEEQRSAILLVGLEGMRYEEVATILNVPVGTIRSRLSRGREALRKLLDFVPDTGIAIGNVAAKATPGEPNPDVAERPQIIAIGACRAPRRRASLGKKVVHGSGGTGAPAR